MTPVRVLYKIKNGARDKGRLRFNRTQEERRPFYRGLVNIHRKEGIAMSQIDERIWDLDAECCYNTQESERFYKKNGLLDDKNSDFKIGQVIEFQTGVNNDIRARAKIKGIKGADIYVYNDCYWFPIQNDEKRKVRLI